MHHFAVAFLPKSSGRERFSSAVAEYIHENLTFRPEEIFVAEAGDACVLSFQANRAVYGIDALVYQDGNDITLVFGLPTFEQFEEKIIAIARKNPAAAMHRALVGGTPSSVYEKVGGTYSVCHLRDEQLVAFSTFSGYGSLYTYARNGMFIVGSRPSIVRAFVPPEARSFNYKAASWIYSSTMILGDETVYSDITKLRPGKVLIFNSGSITEKTLCPRFFCSPDANTRDHEEEVVGSLIKRFEYYFDLPIKWQAHITGGKDSRASIALIKAAGAINKVEQYLTLGDQENGDVIIAKQIAEKLQIRNHTIRAGSKKEVWSQEELAAQYIRLKYTPWRYDGYLTSWDGNAGPAGKQAKTATMMGGGGEVYRQKNITLPTSKPNEASERFKNWYYKYDRLGILSKDFRNWQSSKISEYIDCEIDRGVVNLQPVLYIEHRLSNWGASHFQNNASPSIAGLLDLKLSQLVHRTTDCGDDIHFGVIRGSEPSLLNVPLLNDWWSGPTSKLALEAGLREDILRVPVRKNFPWQYQFAETVWSQLIGEIIDGLHHTGGAVRKDKLEILRTSPPKIDNSATLKCLFGLRSMISLFSGDMHRQRDFEDENYSIQCSGNAAELAFGPLQKLYSARELKHIASMST